MKKLALVVALCLATTACAGSFSKDAYNDIAALRAGYIAANQSRTAYCGSIPEPKPIDLCKETGRAYKDLVAAKQVIVSADALLVTYVETKDADAKAKLKAFLPVVVQTTIDLLKLEVAPPSK